MSSTYAQDTKVPVERSQGEIRNMLIKRAATDFTVSEKTDSFIIGFRSEKRSIVMKVPLPQRPSEKATQASIKTYEQLCRARWRALVLCLKAKFVSIDAKVTTFEDEFMAHIFLPNGKTVGDEMREHIEYAYSQGKMPQLLTFGGVDHG